MSMEAKSSSSETMSIPTSYTDVEILGTGAYGIVLKCHKQETNEFVAVKTSKNTRSYVLLREAQIMKRLMSENLDEANIVKYHGILLHNKKLGLEFELLDISLKKHIATHPPPKLLNEVRNVVQQLAVAFNGLKRVGVIHADLKLDNIMCVDELEEPLRVKLIDFGLAIFRQDAQIGKVAQPHQYRAPELILGLSFSEAIDIWSLGCIMTNMVFNVFIFPGHDVYESLQNIIKLLGPPPQHMLDGGVRTQYYFKRENNSWTLKMPKEYFGQRKQPHYARKQPGQNTFEFNSLDNLKLLRQGMDDDSDDLRDCVDLLKAMLQWDAQQRITPAGILNHPFITRSCAKKGEPSAGPAVPDNGIPSGELKEKTKAKKKGFFSWLKKTFTRTEAE